MSMFRSLMQSRVAPVHDSMFGEVVTHRPMLTRPNFSAELDRSRPMVDVVAIFQDRAALWGGAAPDDMNRRRVPFDRDKSEPPVGVVTSTPQFSFSNPAPKFVRGDLIRRCEDGTVWQITGIYPDAVSRVLVSVVQAGVKLQGEFS